MSKNTIARYMDGVQEYPELIIRSVLSKNHCSKFYVPGVGSSSGDVMKQGSTRDVQLHFQMPNGHWANITGQLWNNEERNLKLTYYIDNCEEYEDYEVVGTYYDTLEETVEAILEDMIELSNGMEEKGELVPGFEISERTGYKAPNIDLEESQQAGVELYKDDGKLKAKFLGTKVVSGKTHNKLSDLQTTGDIKELTPSQKQSVKGIIGSLSSKGKLGDINKDFNTDPDIVFKSNGDAIIYPDDGKSSYRLSASEIEKFEESRKARKRFNEEKLSDDTFISIFNTKPSQREVAVGMKIQKQFMDLLKEPMNRLNYTIKPYHDCSIAIHDEVADQRIMEIHIGVDGKGHWATEVHYIGLEPEDVYDIVETPIQEIVKDIKSVAIPE